MGIFCSKLFVASGQTIITEKVERKLSLSPQIGICLLASIARVDRLGLPTNIFTGYGISPTVGIGLWYRVLPKLSVGTELSYLQAQRNENSLGLFGTGLKLKYNLVSPRKLISPYFTGGVNVWFANISQQKHVRDYYPDDTSGIGRGIRNDRVDYKYNELNIYFAPLLGFSAGAGVDIKVNRKISLFFQASIQGSIATSNIININYPENEFPLQYVSVQGGTHIRLYNKKQFKIDTQAVHIDDHIAMLSPVDEFSEKDILIRKEGKFMVNLHEGMHHAITAVVDHELDLDFDTSPCHRIAKLYDNKQKLIAEAQPDVYGKVNFINLKAGIYKVLISPIPPCEETSFSYQIYGDGIDILSQGNEIKEVDSLSNKSIPIIAGINAIIDGKMNARPQVLSIDMKIYKLYNLEGESMALNGWGFQIGAFRNMQNVVKMMEKLKAEGYESYVQSLMMHDISIRFQSAENYKINRVIVFAGESEVRSAEIKQLLANHGYDIIVKEHFKPETENSTPLGIVKLVKN